MGLACTPATACVPGRAHLLPAGEFSARDGRPGPGRKWRIDDRHGAWLAASFTRQAATEPLKVDFDHLSREPRWKAQGTELAGSMHAAQWISGSGLWVDVRWTPLAARYIEAGEYRYTSAVIAYDEHDTVRAIQMAALCNHPAIVGLARVTAACMAPAVIAVRGASSAPRASALAGQFPSGEPRAAGVGPSTSELRRMEWLCGLLNGTLDASGAKAQREQLRAR